MRDITDTAVGDRAIYNSWRALNNKRTSNNNLIITITFVITNKHRIMYRSKYLLISFIMFTSHKIVEKKIIIIIRAQKLSNLHTFFFMIFQ